MKSFQLKLFIYCLTLTFYAFNLIVLISFEHAYKNSILSYKRQLIALRI